MAVLFVMEMIFNPVIIVSAKSVDISLGKKSMVLVFNDIVMISVNICTTE